MISDAIKLLLFSLVSSYGKLLIFLLLSLYNKQLLCDAIHYSFKIISSLNYSEHQYA